MTISAVVPDIAFTGSGGAGTLGPFSLVKNDTPLVFFANSEVVVLRYDTVTDTTPTLLVEGTHYTLTGGPTAGSITLISPSTGLLTLERLYVTTISALAQSLDLVNGGNFSSSNLERRLDVIFQILQQHDREIKSTMRFAMFDTDEIPKTTPLGVVIDKIPYVTGTAASPTVAYLDALVLNDLSELSVTNLANIALVAADLAGADTIGIVAAAIDDVREVADNIADIVAAAGNGAVATYAALTAIDISAFVGGEVRYVKYRTTSGDGGEGWWQYVIGSSATADGGTILAPDAGTGRWLRQGIAEINLRWFGVIADGATDDAAKLDTFIDALQLFDVPGWIPSGDYAITYVKIRTLMKNLRIDMAPDAKIIGLATKQVFAGDGATTSLTVTTWTKQDEFRVAHVNGTTETLLVENTGYTLTGQVINLAAGSAPFGACPIGQSIKVVDSQPMIELGANSLDLCELEMNGGYIDSSARGGGRVATATDTGSGILLYDFRRVRMTGGYHYASDDYEDAQTNGVGDTAISTISCSNVEIASNTFVGFADNGIYLGGNNNSGEADDGWGASIHSNLFYGCFIGAMNKRQGQGTAIYANTFRYCQIGAGMWPAGGNGIGARGVISGNTFIKCGRGAIDVRQSQAPIISDNRIVDFGYALDGSTGIADPVGIRVLGCDSGLVHNNVILLDAWSRSDQVGVLLTTESTYGPTQTTNTRAHHNMIEGVAKACRESGTGTGNIWDENDIRNVTTPMEVLAARKWHYRNSNVTYEGIGSTLYSGAWTPTVVFAAASPTIDYVTQEGRYIRHAGTNLVTVFCYIQFGYSGSMASNQFRIASLPFTSKNTTRQIMSGSLGYSDPTLTIPANTFQVVPVVVNNTTYVRFHALINTGAPIILNSDHVSSTGNSRFEFTLTYECEPEAVN